MARDGSLGKVGVCKAEDGRVESLEGNDTALSAAQLMQLHKQKNHDLTLINPPVISSLNQPEVHDAWQHLLMGISFS